MPLALLRNASCVDRASVRGRAVQRQLEGRAPRGRSAARRRSIRHLGWARWAALARGHGAAERRPPRVLLTGSGWGWCWGWVI